jgi:hypothetical protein
VEVCPFDDANQGPAAYYGTFATSPQSSWATEGILPADKCPGNRRWMQMVFDAYPGTDDPQPTTNFESPRTGSEATITFKPVDENGTSIPDARIHVGRYEGRVRRSPTPTRRRRSGPPPSSCPAPTCS